MPEEHYKLQVDKKCDEDKQRCELMGSAGYGAILNPSTASRRIQSEMYHAGADRYPRYLLLAPGLGSHGQWPSPSRKRH